MMKFFRSLSAVAIAALPVLSVVEPAIAAPCRYNVYNNAPAQASRKINAMGISFEVPDNYRAELSQDGYVSIFDPDIYQYSQCMARENPGIEISDIIIIEKTDAVVSDERWPYSIPNFGSLNTRGGQPPVFDYARTLSGNDVALMVWEPVPSGTMISYFQNLPSGGSIRLTMPVYDVNEGDRSSILFRIARTFDL